MPGKLKVVAGKLKRLWDRPAFSNVVALMALFVALGGASYAAIKVPKNSVGTRQIKNRAVTAAKLRKNSVNSAKVRNRSLRAVDFRKGQLPRGRLAPSDRWGRLARPDWPAKSARPGFRERSDSRELPERQAPRA